MNGGTRGAAVSGAGIPHSTAAAAQVSPAPKPTSTSLSPVRILPAAIASHSAIGIEAAEVLP